MTLAQLIEILASLIIPAAFLVALIRIYRKRKAVKWVDRAPMVGADREGAVTVTIVFGGMWHFGNPKVAVAFDGVKIGDGPLKSGFQYHLNSGVGLHSLELMLRFDAPKKFAVEFPRSGKYVVILQFKRAIGSFVAPNVEFTDGA